MPGTWCHAAASRRGCVFFPLKKILIRVSCLLENDIISLRWKVYKEYIFVCLTHTMWPHISARLHAGTHKAMCVCDRWMRLIASALHHEWQQEVSDADLWRKGKWKWWLCLWTLSHLYLQRIFTPLLYFSVLQHRGTYLCFAAWSLFSFFLHCPILLMHFVVFLCGEF